MMIGTAENRAFYDIAMRYKNAEGNWVEVDEANFPTGGVEVVLPYPNGTDSKDTFTIVHMLTTAARAGELDNSKPVYIHCRTVLRSYVACCMLAGMGFDCYNLSGGWRLYESILSETKSPEHGCYDPN